MVFDLFVAVILFISVVIFCGKDKSRRNEPATSKSGPMPSSKPDPLASVPIASPPKQKESKVILTKDVPAAERPKHSKEQLSKEPPENCPIGPPPKDQYDDTLRDVNSLQADLSQSVKKKNGGKNKKG